MILAFWRIFFALIIAVKLIHFLLCSYLACFLSTIFFYFESTLQKQVHFQILKPFTANLKKLLILHTVSQPEIARKKLKLCNALVKNKIISFHNLSIKSYEKYCRQLIVICIPQNMHLFILFLYFHRFPPKLRLFDEDYICI